MSDLRIKKAGEYGFDAEGFWIDLEGGQRLRVARDEIGRLIDMLQKPLATGRGGDALSLTPETAHLAAEPDGRVGLFLRTREAGTIALVLDETVLDHLLRLLGQHTSKRTAH